MFVLCIRTLAIAVLKKFSIHIPFCNGMAEVRDAKESIYFGPSSIILTFEAFFRMRTFGEAISLTYN